MMVFPYGAVIAAMNISRNNQKEQGKKKENSKPTSRISISVNDDDIEMNFNMANDFDWARAAWALFRACDKKGQKDNLLRLLAEEEAETISGGLD